MAAKTETPTKPKSRYRGDRRPTTVLMSEPLVKLAQEYFALPATARGMRHSSLSSLLNSTLSSFVRKNAARIRKAGLKVPESVFAD